MKNNITATSLIVGAMVGAGLGLAGSMLSRPNTARSAKKSISRAADTMSSFLDEVSHFMR